MRVDLLSFASEDRPAIAALVQAAVMAERKTIGEVVKAAVTVEREACAKEADIVERASTQILDPYGKRAVEGSSVAAKAIAQRIRSRGRT